MKQKEVIQLSVAAVIIGIAGMFIFAQLNPKKSAGQGIAVEVIKPIPANFDTPTLDKVSSPAFAHDFYTKPDLHNGIGNNQPFGQ